MWSLNKELFDNATVRKEMALNKVFFWDSKEGTSVLIMEEQHTRKQIGEEYKKWVILEETSQRHKRVMVEGGWQEYQFLLQNG